MLELQHYYRRLGFLQDSKDEAEDELQEEVSTKDKKMHKLSAKHLF